MRQVSGLVLLALGIVWAVPVLEAQPERTLRGRLFWIDERGERSPAADVSVASRAVEPVRTAADGTFLLPIDDVFRAGETLALETGADGWFIGRPADGQVAVPYDLARETVEIELHREGSDVAWSDERVDRFLVDAAWLSLERLDRSGDRHGFDLDFYCRRFARLHGWSLEKVRREVRDRIDRAARQDDGLQRGLAAFARGEVAEAAGLFRAAGETSRRLLESRSESESDDLRFALARAHSLEAVALSAAGSSAEAARAFERTLDHVSRQTAPQTWARAKYGLGTVHLELGTEPRDPAWRVSHLETARRLFQEALQVWDREHFPEAWSAARHGLGRSVNYLVQFSSAPDAEREQQLRLAIRLLRDAAELRRRDELPYLWASTQSQLTTPLLDLANFHPGAQGQALITEAIEIYRRVREVRTQEETPDLWAMNQANMAFALGTLAERSSGSEAVRLYEEMVALNREVLGLEIPGLSDYGRRVCNVHLANAATELANRLPEQRRQWLGQAAQARREVLGYVDRQAEPAPWTVAAYELGETLFSLAMTMDPGTDRQVLAQASDALTRTLEAVAETRALPVYLPRSKLAEVRWLQDRRNEAVALMQVALKENPDYREGHLYLRSWAQDHLGDFELAYRTLSGWLRRHPADFEAIVSLTENLFTTGRFDECLEHIAAIRRDSRMQLEDEVYIRIFEIAALRILGHPSNELASLVVQLSEQLRWLSPKLPAAWNIRGAYAYVQENDAVVAHRSWLLRLFETLRLSDRAAVVEGLHRLAEAVDSLQV